MKAIIAVGFIGAFASMLAINQRLNTLQERYEFMCSLPIVTNKSVLLLQEREGRWVLDKDMKDSFFYVSGGCN